MTKCLYKRDGMSHSGDMEATATFNKAHPVHHNYPSTDKSFYTVQCDICNTVMNSGHHYSDLSSAWREADRHNVRARH